MLSQWRGYSNNAAGISIGLNSGNLKAYAKERGLHVIRCIYNESEHDAIAISLILDAIEIIDKLKSKEVPIDRIQERFSLAALACKNPLFSEEREWRLVLINEDCSKDSIGVRANGKRLVPYYKFDLPPWSQKGIVNSCYVGPNAAFSDIEGGLRQLITNQICGEFSISESRIPYR